MPPELAARSAGVRLAMVLAHVRDGTGSISDREMEGDYRTAPPGVPVERWRQSLAKLGESLGRFEVEGYEMPGERMAVALLRAFDGRTWRIAVGVDDAETAPVRAVGSLPVPAGVTVRPATPADATVLRALERDIPVTSRDLDVATDRGEDYFRGERLMGTATTLVAEQEGRIVGLQSLARTQICVGGELLSATYLHRLRLLPGARGGGAAWYLNHRCWEHTGWKQDTQYGFVGKENEAARAWYRGQHEWPIGPRRLLFRNVDAASAASRPATPADAARIVQLLNATHAREELFVPYTAESLARRLSREPAAYGWGDVRLTEHAVLGTWTNAFTVIRRADLAESSAARSLALDYGFEPGHESELMTLIAAVLRESGCDEVSLFSSEQSPAYAYLAERAASADPYVVFCMTPPADDLAERGIYVDQVYV